MDSFKNLVKFHNYDLRTHCGDCGSLLKVLWDIEQTYDMKEDGTRLALEFEDEPCSFLQCPTCNNIYDAYTDIEGRYKRMLYHEDMLGLRLHQYEQERMNNYGTSK